MTASSAKCDRRISSTQITLFLVFVIKSQKKHVTETKMIRKRNKKHSTTYNFRFLFQFTSAGNGGLGLHPRWNHYNMLRLQITITQRDTRKTRANWHQNINNHWRRHQKPFSNSTHFSSRILAPRPLPVDSYL